MRITVMLIFSISIGIVVAWMGYFVNKDWEAWFLIMFFTAITYPLQKKFINIFK